MFLFVEGLIWNRRI